ncbi:MAG: peptide chain release factor-like protein [Pirellulaceae bacterium]|nr:peptide chain release factor-like protein [Pirellulaceae bacterium]
MCSPFPHPACQELDQLVAGCEFQRTRSFGPGGQHRNKVESAVVVTHLATGISGQASERRSQHENRRKAISRLRINLAIGSRTDPKKLAALSPSQLWSSRCRGGRIGISSEHDDFPAMLAEALDQICANDWDATVAAKSLGCTTSQLIKLFKKETAAFELVNRERSKRNLKKYRY